MADVLVVEDDEDIAGLIETVLVRRDHRVDLAPDGDEGWRLVQRNHYDLVIVDWTMPGLDGIDFLAACRSTPALAEVPIIMVTARVLPEEVKQVVEAGATAYLTKPFSPRRLVGLVASLTGTPPIEPTGQPH